ncbi:MAG: cyclase family protein [Acidobacteria bacterium]|nr:cyclase family protein [Acidobacteriota bacterium]
MVSLLFASALLAQAPEAAHFLRYEKILDLTHTLDESTPTYEETNVPVYQAKTVATIEKEHYFAREICLPEHFGTHLDAPAHFARGHWTLDQIPPERLVAEMVVLDVGSKVKRDPDYRASVEDVIDWEKANGQIPNGAVVILRTGWESRWNSAKEYRNADSKGVMHFPGYSLEAAKLLVGQRMVYGLGIDTLSVDYGPSPDFAVHQFSLAHDIYHLENLANLSRLPARGSQVIVAPMKLAGGSGSPARVLALVQ